MANYDLKNAQDVQGVLKQIFNIFYMKILINPMKKFKFYQ